MKTDHQQFTTTITKTSGGVPVKSLSAEIENFLSEIDSIDALKITLSPSNGSATENFSFSYSFQRSEKIDPVKILREFCLESLGFIIFRMHEAKVTVQASQMQSAKKSVLQALWEEEHS
ncbi:MAG TPA: hypothetical protein PKA63_06985 [Oligoflexia bacterium]|nr:hypothetical protein [Oligoflexia bacterium]HMP48395.1 hypothetical protein [Oligoflexia bacterium]